MGFPAMLNRLVTKTRQKTDKGKVSISTVRYRKRVRNGLTPFDTYSYRSIKKRTESSRKRGSRLLSMEIKNNATDHRKSREGRTAN